MIFELRYPFCDYGGGYVELARCGGKTAEAGDDQKRIDVQNGVDEALFKTGSFSNLES